MTTKKPTKKATKKTTATRAAEFAVGLDSATKKAAKKKAAKEKAAKKPPVLPPVQKVPTKTTPTPKSAPTLALNSDKGREWLVFSDLHYSPKTKDRALAALAHMREQAMARKVDAVIFTGDFWDQRGALPVRLLDALLHEIDQWEAAKIQMVLIPGNHDQVTRDGMVHSLAVLEAYSNVTVATDVTYEPTGKVAYLPWREEADEQAALFEDLPGDGWTIFAHAEIGGARTNHGFVSPGRVALSTIESKAFACYLGHYHMRQKHGAATWYMGNPFELDFREVDEPKGYAIVTEGVQEPEWFEIPDMPKHLLWQVPDNWDGVVPARIANADPRDYVRVHATHEQLEDERLSLNHPQLQRIASRSADNEEPPAFALSLTDAIDQLLESVPKGDRAEYRETGLGILSEIQQLPRPAETQVELVHVEITNFASISGTVSLPLPKGTFALITGAIGLGKTSIIDAITWAPFGQTSPRKAGSDSAVMRGDEVINDNADHCRVDLTLQTPGGEFHVIREKIRGKGAIVRVVATSTGQPIALPDGIADTTDWIRVMVGYDYALWRSSVSLGQGAVGNFVTAADKARKELLLDSLGLSVCTPARAAAKKLSKSYEDQLASAMNRRTSAAAKLEALAEYDFDEMIQIWERYREQRVIDTEAIAAQQQQKIEACDAQLANRPQWEEAHRALREGQAGLATQRQPVQDQLQQARLLLARATAEQSAARNNQVRVAGELSELRKSKTMLCPTCGTEMGEDAAASALQKATTTLDGYDAEFSAAESRVKTFTLAVDEAQTALTAMDAELTEKRELYAAQEQAIASAMQTFAKIDANRTAAMAAVHQSTGLLTQLRAEQNPHTVQAQRHAHQKETLATDLQLAQEAIEELTRKQGIFDFWVDAFGPKQLPVLALRPVMHSLQESANKHLAQLVDERLAVQLSMTDDAMDLEIYERCPDGELRQRRYEQLSGGMRRCVELAFSPFALGDFARKHLGRRIDYLAVDELTAGLGHTEKARAVEMLRAQGIGRVLVVDHDPEIQGAFDEMYHLTKTAAGASTLSRI